VFVVLFYWRSIRLIRRPCFSFIMILEVFAISLVMLVVNLLAIILNTNVALNCV
jgi:hypothetical protein